MYLFNTDLTHKALETLLPRHGIAGPQSPTHQVRNETSSEKNIGLVCKCPSESLSQNYVAQL